MEIIEWQWWFDALSLHYPILFIAVPGLIALACGLISIWRDNRRDKIQIR